MKPMFEQTQGSENAYLGWTDNQLQRRPFPHGTIVPAVCQLSFDVQTVSSSTTSFEVLGLEYIRVVNTDVFEQADIATYDYGVQLNRRGLYYTEARVREAVNAGHENRGYPRDLVINVQNGGPNIISGRLSTISSNIYQPESAEGTFAGWKSGVNASANPASPTVIRLIETITRAWFLLDSGDVGAVIGWMYRQITGFDQTISTGNGIIVWFPSEYDNVDESELLQFNYPDAS